MRADGAVAGAGGGSGAPGPSPCSSTQAALAVWRTLYFSPGVFQPDPAKPVAWNRGVAQLGIQAGAVWQNMVPVFAVLISALFFGVVPTGWQLAGGAVVMAGVLWMQWQQRRGPQQGRPA